MKFSDFYTLFIFFSTKSFYKDDLDIFCKKFDTLLETSTFATSIKEIKFFATLCRYDFLIMITTPDLREIPPFLCKVIDKSKIGSKICYSLIFSKQLFLLDTEIKFKNNQYPIASITFIRLSKICEGFEEAFLNRIKSIEATKGVSINLYWDMNIFQFIISIHDYSLVNVKNCLLRVLYQIQALTTEYNFNFTKSSTFFNIQLDYKRAEYIPDEKTENVEINFLIYIKLNENSLSFLRYEEIKNSNKVENKEEISKILNLENVNGIEFNNEINKIFLKTD